MKMKVWKYQGTISTTKIREKTGCDKVLVEVAGRKNVPGTSLIAWYDQGNLRAVPMWQYTWEINQKDTVIIPMNFLYREHQKAAMYRIVRQSEVGKRYWIEARSKYYKVGQRFKVNEFILVYEDESKETKGEEDLSNKEA